MKIYYNQPKANYGANTKSGTRTFTDKFYYFMEKTGHTITNNLNDDYDIHFVLCADGNIHISKTRGIPVVVRVDGMYSPACGPDYKERNQPIINTVKQADHVIFLNPFCKDSFEYFAGFKVKNYDFICNGCDTDIFKPDLKKEFTNKILWYGEMRREVQIKPLINSIELIRKEIPDAEFLFVGGGYKEVIDTIPDKPYIKQIGPVENFNMPKYADKCSVMACSVNKPADHSTVSECLACGLPVVCYDAGGVHYKVKDAGIILKSEYYGWDRWPNENAQEYADAVIKVLEDKYFYFVKACDRRKDLSLAVMADKYIKVFEEILK